MMKEILLPTGEQIAAPRPLHERLPRFLGQAAGAAEGLANLQVMVVGCGSVGRNIGLHLGRLQPRRVILVDRGRLKAESLLTHPAMPEDIPEPKASNLGFTLKRLSPATRVFAFDSPFQNVDLTLLAGCEYVYLATDNLLAEVAVAQQCLSMGVPLIQASVDGATLVAQVRFFSNLDGSGPCPLCGFSRMEWKALNEETRFSCEGSASGTGQDVGGHPTMSVSFLCSLAAGLAMIQTIRHRLFLGAPVQETLLEYCGVTHRTVISPLKRNQECPCEHVRCRQVPTERPIPDCTLRELAEASGLGTNEDLDGLSFRVDDDLVFHEMGACGCAESRPLMKFLKVSGPPSLCGSCGDPIRPLPFFAHQPLPSSVAVAELDRPLRALGAQKIRHVLVRGDTAAVLLYNP